MMTEQKFERIYTAAAFTAVYIINSGFVLPFFAMASGFLPVLIGYILILGVMLAGYWLQAFFCRITGFERTVDNGTYEATVRFFNPSRAFPVIAAEVIAGLASIGFFKYLFFALIDANIISDDFYDNNSLYPYMFAIAFTVTVIIGSIIWFYPYRRFTLLRFTLAGFVFVMIGGVFCLMAGQVFVMAFNILIYSLVAVMLMNQGTITRGYQASDKVSFLTGRARMYNMLMTGSLFGVYAVSAVVLFIITTSITVLVRIIMVAVLLVEKDTDQVVDTSTGAVSNFVLGNTKIEKASSSVALTIFLGAAAVVIFFVLMRKSHVVARFIEKIKNFIAYLLDALFSFTDRKRVKAQPDEGFRSYKDEEKKLQRATIRPYGGKDPESRSYRDFIYKLNSIKDDGERVGFAYTVLVMQLMSAHKYIKASDTPREISAKISDDPYYSGIEGITEAFETVTYAERGLDSSSADMTVATLCTILKRHFG